MNLDNLFSQLDTSTNALPPVDKWNPDFCGDMDIVIKEDGSWHYQGTPFTRQKLVRLFSTVIKKEDDKYFLVTPVEKVGITVQETPFVITDWEWENVDSKATLVLISNVGDKVLVTKDNPIDLRLSLLKNEERCYVNMRTNLDAVLHRNVFYQLVESGEELEIAGKNHLTISSAGHVFSLGVID